MNTLAKIIASLNVRLARLRDVAIAHLAALKQSVSTILVDARRNVATKSALARQAVSIAFSLVLDHTAPVVAVLVDIIRPVRERLVALVPPFQRGIALVLSMPLAFFGTQVALGAAGSIGLGFIKLSLAIIAVDILLGLIPCHSCTEIRRNLRVAIAGSLASIAFAAASVGTALDPGPTTPAVATACAPSATSPVVAAHDVTVVPELEDLVPARPAERRNRRRVAGSNGRA